MKYDFITTKKFDKSYDKLSDKDRELVDYVIEN